MLRIIPCICLRQSTRSSIIIYGPSVTLASFQSIKVKSTNCGERKHSFVAVLNRGRAIVASIMKTLNEAGEYETKEAALNRGRDFVVSIMQEIEEIPGSDGMRVLPGVVQLETDDRYDVVIRKVTQPFWEECIRVASTPKENFRVCALGTPGIGKTSSTPFLIRILLEQKRTVVYHIASSDYIWEFSWTNGKRYNVKVYSKDTSFRAIPILLKPSTFYVFDPGNTDATCVLDPARKARTIIVSSPNEGHWGGKEFEKLRGTLIGFFRYLPMWSLHDILKAKCYLSRTPPSDEELMERFRQVGGIPRHLFMPEEAFSRCLQSQKEAIRALTFEQAQEIFEGDLDAVGSFGANRPKSSLIGYAMLPGEIRFSSRHVALVSPSVAESIAEKFIGDLWNHMLKQDHYQSSIFEDYCRRQMARPARSFLSRKGCGKTDTEYKGDEYVTLGGCSTIRMESDIVKSVITGNPMTLYHSVDPRYPLIDFIYKDGEGKVHAFQPTVGKKHVFRKDKMRELRAKLGDKPLALHYLIPGENYDAFVTAPTNPKIDELTEVFHVLIRNPNKETRNPENEILNPNNYSI